MNPYRTAFSHIRTFPSAFWVVIGATFMNQAGNMAFVFLMLYLTQVLGLSLSEASFAFVALSGSMLFSGFFGGGLVDKVGAARLMMGTLFANGLVLLIFPFIFHYFTLLWLCLLWGFFYGLYRPASQTLVSLLSTQGLHKITFSVYRLSLNLGMSIGPALGGYLAHRSFATIFLANGIANILASIILIIGLSRSRWFNYRPGKKHQLDVGLKWLRQDAVLRLFVLSMIPVSMVFFQHDATLPIFLHRDLHLSVTFYGLLFTLNTLMIVFFELPLNIATINWPYRINLMLGSAFITMGFAGMLFATQRWHVLLLTGVWTLGEMILYPSSSSYIADIAPAAHRGSYMSMYSTCSNLGMLFGPACGAIVMEHFGAAGLWIACGFWGMLSVVMFNLLQEPKTHLLEVPLKI